MSFHDTASILRTGDVWVNLTGSEGVAHIPPARLQSVLGIGASDLSRVRIFDLQILSYFCERWPVFLSVSGDPGDVLNKVDADDYLCFAVLFGVSHKPYAHAAGLGRFARVRLFDLSHGLWFNFRSTRGKCAPPDAGFLLRLGLVPAEGHIVVEANNGSQLKSPVMRRVKSTPETRCPRIDIDKSPSYPRFRRGDNEWSENDLPTPYQTTDTEGTLDSDATVVVHKSESSDDPQIQVEDTPPPHHRRSGSDVPPVQSRVRFRETHTRDPPSSSGAEDLRFY